MMVRLIILYRIECWVMKRVYEQDESHRDEDVKVDMQTYKDRQDKK